MNFVSFPENLFRQAIELLDYWIVRLPNCPTIYLSDDRTVGLWTVELSNYQNIWIVQLSNCWTIELSDYQTVGRLNCRNIQLSDY